MAWLLIPLLRYQIGDFENTPIFPQRGKMGGEHKNNSRTFVIRPERALWSENVAWSKRRNIMAISNLISMSWWPRKESYLSHFPISKLFFSQTIFIIKCNYFIIHEYFFGRLCNHPFQYWFLKCLPPRRLNEKSSFPHSIVFCAVRIWIISYYRKS